MRLGAIFAVAFGPFQDKTLHLAPGMTVIAGINESGKSSWHAAIYAALCGLRRGRGANRKEDKDFTSKHRPWSGKTWEVGALLELDDGRRIELRQDLELGVGSRALDADLGRDVSGEIMHEGAPDAARWLGLDRRAFLAVSCVRQADLLGVMEEPELLQEHLQRAAATAATDATAATAIDLLEEYRRDRVGQDRANSTRPLRQATEALRSAGVNLAEARAQHDEFLLLAARAEELLVASDAATRSVRMAQAGKAHARAEAAKQRLKHAGQLAAGFPDGPPAARELQDDLGMEVAATLAGWIDRPEIPVLEGQTSRELRERLATLPAEPQGDVEMHPDVVAAADDVARWRRDLDLNESVRPAEPEPGEAQRLSDGDLLRLAQTLEMAAPAFDPAPQERVDELTEELKSLPGATSERTMVALAALVAGGGLACIVLEQLYVGLALLVAGIGALSWSATRSSAAERGRKLDDLRAAQAAVVEQRHTATMAAQRKSAAEEEASEHGLAADPRILRELARTHEESRQKRIRFNIWASGQRERTERLGAAENRLADALGQRGISITEDVAASLAIYEKECAERASVAIEAARRPDLETQLSTLLAAEAAAEAIRQRRQSAQERLRRTANACNVDGDDDEELVRALQRWQQNRATDLEAQEKRRADWAELQLLLDGNTLEELAATAEALAGESERHIDTLGVDEIPGEPDEAEMERLRAEAEAAVRWAAEARGRLSSREKTLTPVTEAEEGLAAAERELARVQRLDETLGLTLDFLKGAQERVHRDIARILADTIRPWLPNVTMDRYNDVLIDPETLEVRVSGRGGEWRQVPLLSRGTAEQIYLLLRMALAKHLATSDETCPLILDDITVQSDGARKVALLDLLHAISRQRQVILFTQEDEVVRWAERALEAPDDRLERLDAPTAPT